jgi:putative ABC transport system substrate-binding protein
MIGRRVFIAGLGGAAAWPLAARAQQTDRKRRIGALIGLPPNDAVGEVEIAAFQQALQKLGWTAGPTSKSHIAGPAPMPT